MDSEATPSLPSTLTKQQGQEILGVLQKPVTGRHVMIPVTSKAFVVGQLQPALQGQEEMVMLKNAQGELKQISRTTLVQQLQEKKKGKQKNKATVKEKPKSILKKTTSEPKKDTQRDSLLNTQQNSTTATPRSTNNNNSITNSKADLDLNPKLPYFEIQEEMDDTGKIIKSQAINVTKQLQLVAKNSEEGEEKIDTEDETKSSDHEREEEPPSAMEKEIADTIHQEAPQTWTPVSDQDYDILSKRLDQLALLEEQAEREAGLNQRSAKFLQSTGWAKGFLKQSSGAASGKKNNNGKNKNSAKKSNTNLKRKEANNNQDNNPSSSISAATPTNNDSNKAATAQPEAIYSATQATTVTAPGPSQKITGSKKKASGGWNKGFLASGFTATTTTTPNANNSKKVSFHNNAAAEVREIPKIGTASVSSFKKQPATNSTLPARSTTPRTFDPSVFSGVVTERPVQQQQQGGIATNHDTTEKPKKKLSKFAMERLQQQQGM